jgi:hypothetical protein
MRKRFDRAWMDTYNVAFKNYVKGNWSVAETEFRKILEMKEDDKPTLNLLDFMAKTNMKAPSNWNGTKASDD